MPMRWERMARSSRQGVMRHRLTLMLSAPLLVACSVTPTPTAIGPPDEPGPSASELTTGTVTEDGITLAVSAEPAVVAAGVPIDVEAVITHDRPDALVVSGSGSGIVSFSVTRLEDGLTSGPSAMTGDCARHQLPAGAPTVVPFSKSGGYSPDDPNADFLDIYFSRPELTLPLGTWQVDVATHGSLGEGCGGPPLDLTVSVVVTVTD